MKAETQATICNESGLHVRAAAIVRRTASRFHSVVTISFGGEEAGTDSVLEMITLGAAKGAILNVSASGEDSEEAVAAIRDVIERGFAGEDHG